MKSLKGETEHIAWKKFTDAFWNSEAHYAGDKAQFLFRRGFLRDKWALYDFAQTDPEVYLSDLQAAQVVQANGIYVSVLQDRMLLCHTLSEYCRVPRIHALRGFGAEEVSLSADWQAHREDINNAPPLEVTIQPLIAGTRGRTETVKVRNGSFDGFGKSGSMDRLSKIVRDWSQTARLPYLFSETLRSSAKTSALAGGHESRLSVILVRDLQNWEPAVVSATLMLGTFRSKGGLQFGQGALSAPVDVDTGEIGLAVELTEGGRLHHHTTHPETGAPIAGTGIEGWEQSRRTLLRIMDESSYMRMALLDFALLENGELGLLGPSQVDFGAVQVHGPLLGHPVFAETLRKLVV
ncbi:sugar-transfer associated ATP-grasp domain-containing protein [Limimaricola cinnabarinus]|uniref:sugar-transfer associated ATP-grasp domain-containing protein n=1 Tax=Limimaricola cinnabarinus TaxID=1125964 RepID=UPI0024900136|nr:sugar-transfer associated ATP-grasp domain-containing protein [Limimaricola cinnabarinus]